MTAFRSIRTLHARVALLLAVTYLLFRVEPFEDEYLEQNRGPADRPAFSTPSVNWETFDKSNAPKAFTIDPAVAIGPLHLVALPDEPLDPCAAPAYPVRDKSPPPLSA